MPVNFIRGLPDVRNQPLLEGVGRAAEAIGQAHSQKTLKSMFQDVIDGGGSVKTAMQKILPYDSELAEKLGEKESEAVGNRAFRELIRERMPDLFKQLGSDAEKMSAGQLAGVIEVVQGQEAEEARAMEAAEKASRARYEFSEGQRLKEEELALKYADGSDNLTPKWEVVQDPASPTGWSRQNLNDPTAPLVTGAPRPASYKPSTAPSPKQIS